MLLKNLFNNIVNYILPNRCIGCYTLIDSGKGLCGQCFNKINFISEPYCNICGFPFEFSTEEKLTCLQCAGFPPHFDYARSIFRFDDHSRHIIHRFKYQDFTSYAEMFAKFLVSKNKALLDGIDCIIPVPMNRLKRIFRQYNPPQILALEIAKLTGIQLVADGLIKIKWTKPQSSLSKKKRATNLKGSIIVNKHLDSGYKCILLIDDVKTTGSTVNYCAKILKKAGISKVIVFTIGLR